MSSRIIIGGRTLGTGYAEARCLCGAPVVILGRCAECHDALQRRRRGMAPNDAAEKRRLDAYLQRYQQHHQRCHECGAPAAPWCHSCESRNVQLKPPKCLDCGSQAVDARHDSRRSFSDLDDAPTG